MISSRQFFQVTLSGIEAKLDSATRHKHEQARMATTFCRQPIYKKYNPVKCLAASSDVEKRGR